MNQLPLTTLDQAKALKEAGFDWPCYDYFLRTGSAFNEKWEDTTGEIPENRSSYGDHVISRPTIALALQWIQQTHKIDTWVAPHNEGKGYQWWYVPVENKDKWCGSGPRFDTPEEAEAALLTELLKIITALKTEKA